MRVYANPLPCWSGGGGGEESVREGNCELSVHVYPTL